MKTIMSFFATLLFSANGFTQTSTEVMCRAQAKEIALQKYSNCVTDARSKKVEEIRKNYQKDLANLKSKYDNELKKMGAVKGQTSPQALEQTSKTKKNVVRSNETASVRSVTEGTKVVAVGESESSEVLEKEANGADQPDFVEMPVE